MEDRKRGKEVRRRIEREREGGGVEKRKTNQEASCRKGKHGDAVDVDKQW